MTPTHDDQEGWRTRAACRDARYDPDWWTGGIYTGSAQAMFVCRHVCPVQAQCRLWAVDHPGLAAGAVYGGIEWTTRSRRGGVRPSGNQPRPMEPWTNITCGTQAAVSGHRRRGEPLDEACRRYDAQRKQQARNAA